MGCDIHLMVEMREKPSLGRKSTWCGAGFVGEFSVRIYGMFARMAKVRDYYGDLCKVQFEPRGLPNDITFWAQLIFYMRVTAISEAIEWGSGYCTKEDAERWVSQGLSEWYDESHMLLTNPDHHSHSWLTTQELRQCFDDCFKKKDGTYYPYSDYAEWLGLVSFCEGVESDGKHECRVVFAFDN